MIKKTDTIYKHSENRFVHLDRIEESSIGMSTVFWILVASLSFIAGFVFYFK